MALSGGTTYDPSGGAHTAVSGSYDRSVNPGLEQYVINALNRKKAWEAQMMMPRFQPESSIPAGMHTGGQPIPPPTSALGSAGDPTNDPQRRILNAQATIAEAQSRAVPKKRVDIPGYGSYLVDDWDNVPAAMRPNTQFAATANPAAEDFSTLEDFATRRGKVDAINAMNADKTRQANAAGDSFSHNYSNNYAAQGGGGY